MKRSAWILLLVLALVIGAYFYFKAHPLKSNSSTPTETPRAFVFNFSDEAGNIASIRIQDADGRYILLAHDMSDKWTIKAPVAGAVDQDRLNSIGTQINALGINSYLETEPDLEVIGLKPPAFSIEIRYDNGKLDTLEVGSEVPSGSGYYVRANGKVYIVAQYNIDVLTDLLATPPYLATLTPTEAPTEVLTATPTVPPTATDTPTPEPATPATPTP